ncbi:052R [Invertebrate iridescent virus Kaz2018]|uniref:Uncharacterized protein n=1 Tax=Iridovirus sp. TaxID=135728 RepID=A0AAU7YC47_9VIRU|nr:052R [Invertebrate iridescent virus Kaz2018]
MDRIFSLVFSFINSIISVDFPNAIFSRYSVLSNDDDSKKLLWGWLPKYSFM